jgi:hypothetical protein
VSDTAKKRCDGSGAKSANGSLYRIYEDVRHMHARLGAYDPREMATWLDNMGKESRQLRRPHVIHAGSGTRSRADRAGDTAAGSRRVHYPPRRSLKFGRADTPSAWAIVRRSKLRFLSSALLPDCSGAAYLGTTADPRESFGRVTHGRAAWHHDAPLRVQP